MFAEQVSKVSELLMLQRQIVGVRFIPFELEYERLDAPEVKGQARLCAFVNKACRGGRLKVWTIVKKKDTKSEGIKI